ncbi:hypothetical protein BJI69_13565 [Luteibacter rhizovicinus DSM 16549]|uniref:Uncharacterized protein n=1 Tax=Luteibacter rhizovicinus DSM 16549 TaxID=1440763 RepID=A0A0G9HD23_9GAMM|nr:hypothetical protein BJI69_13565 [Luteibacter rhizovicinus DSM 16549]KLD67406.1 hypothetical protein Y883_07860 [Luteibacter rhizovicinus DSM 16549]KLD73957.1 hypothetical protein Y886_35230 [Xanthomonas hyacinthi DSM 19077]
MWISHTQRAWIRKEEALALTAEAGRAEARFHGVTKAIDALLADSRAKAMLRRLGIRRVALGRSSRLPENERAEGLAVLEGVVLAGVVARILSDSELTLWLSCHHPVELAILHRACGRGLNG